MTVLSKNLKRFRTEKHLTQDAAAEALGVSTQTVSRWECATTLPDADRLPEIARLYATTIDDLFKENSLAYDNYAQRLGCVHEATRDPADFLRADIEFRKLLRTGNFSADDIRMYAILHQYMMEYCIQKTDELFQKGLAMAKADDDELYWCIKRQQISCLADIGRGEEAVAELLPAVRAGSDDMQAWICLIHAFAHWKRAQQLEPTWMDSAYAIAECYEELGDHENACAAWQAIADDLSARGYDVEANWPRDKARRCKEKLGKA